MGELYTKVLHHFVHERRLAIGCPYCGIDDMSYTIHGYYPRKIIDLIPITDEDGKPVVDAEGYVQFEDFNEDKEMSLNVCRIKCKEDGTTHAVLFNFFVPYKRQTIRYIVYHLWNLYRSDCSMEQYCANHNLSRRVIKKWIRYLEEVIPLLCQAQIVPETVMSDRNRTVKAVSEDLAGKENKPGQESVHAALPARSIVRKTYWLKPVIEWILTSFEKFYRGHLKHFQRVMFQTHRSPTNTRFQFP